MSPSATRQTGTGSSPGGPAPTHATQRLDIWLHHARFFRTRSLATSAVAAGNMRLDRQGQLLRPSRASFQVQIGDVLTFMFGNQPAIIEVVGMTARREGAKVAATLYRRHDPYAPDTAAAQQAGDN